MVERFLQYSLTHNRKIRVIFSDTLKMKNITVIALSDRDVSFIAASSKKPVTQPLENILTATYARGDRGDPLENEMKEGLL